MRNSTVLSQGVEQLLAMPRSITIIVTMNTIDKRRGDLYIVPRLHLPETAISITPRLGHRLAQAYVKADAPTVDATITINFSLVRAILLISPAPSKKFSIDVLTMVKSLGF